MRSVHGIWDQPVSADTGALYIGDRRLTVSRNMAIGETDWSGCDVVIEASGKMGNTELLEVERPTRADTVNRMLKTAAEGELKGILGDEERALISVDSKTDPRSSIIDALSTLVICETQVKLYAWCDNEWGYANRTAELACKVGLADR